MRDLNPHGVNHQILSLARLPIPPIPHKDGQSREMEGQIQGIFGRSVDVDFHLEQGLAVGFTLGVRFQAFGAAAAE